MKRAGTNRSDSERIDLTVRDYGLDGGIASAHTVRKRRIRRQTRFLAGLAILLVLTAASIWLIKTISGNTAPTTESSPPTTHSSATASATVTPKPTSTPVPTPIPTTTKPQLSAEERQSLLQQAGDEVVNYLDQVTTGRIGIYFQNLVNGERWAHNDEMPFVAASSIKLGINTYLYTRVAAGEISLDEVLRYDNRAYPTGDYEAGTGTVQNLPDGTELSVRETSKLAITISDNCATNMIIRRLGGIDAINPWLNKISGVVDYRQKVSYTNYAGQSQNGRHRTCARDLGLQAVSLFGLWQENPQVFAPLIEDLSHTEFDFGIIKGLPDDLVVAHKIGTNGAYATENDLGIVFAEEPFVLCVLTEMASAERARKIQADIAAIFYEKVASWPWP